MSCSTCPCLPSPSSPSRASGRIQLNVGGKQFVTSRATLVSRRTLGSRFEELLEGGAGEDGSHFLDRDGRNFHHILAFLRDGADGFIVPESSSVCRELLQEAKYFRLKGLVEVLEDLGFGGSPTGRSQTSPRAATDEVSDTSPSALDRGFRHAPLPANEEARVAKLKDLQILDTQQEHQYDCITQMVAAVLEVPIAIVGLVDSDRQWYKSKFGFDACETDRQSTFCVFSFVPEDPKAHSVLLVEDALRDSRFYEHPAVAGPPNVRFYAGCPLVTSEGLRLGTLCAIDFSPRALSPVQVQILVNFGQLTVQAIEQTQLAEKEKEGAGEVLDPEEDLNFAGGALRLARMKEALHEAVLFVWARADSMDWPVLFANQAWTELTGIRVTPPSHFPGRAQIQAPPGIEAGSSIWEQMQLETANFEQVMSIWKHVRGQHSNKAEVFAVSATVSLKPVEGKPRGRASVDCRFTPAEQPLDAAAAAIRAPGSGLAAQAPLQIAGLPPGRPYFVTVVRRDDATKPPGPAAISVQPGIHLKDSASTAASVGLSIKTTGSSLSSVKKDAGMREVSAMKPPRPPFEDVRLLRLVGQGSFGTVYFGLWSGASVAVKVIRNNKDDKSSSSIVDFEAALSASISHPNLVQTYKFGQRMCDEANAANAGQSLPPDSAGAQHSETWIVQEWCDGGTLRENCKTPRLDGQNLLNAIDIAIEIARAGSYLHDLGIIHGDLTPNNVLAKMMPNRKGFVCKVCDFGLARVLEGESQEIITQTMGTVTHMPPELFALHNNCRLTQKADVYALGMILYQVVSAQAPYYGLKAPQIVIQVSRGKRLKLPDEVHQPVVDFYSKCVAPDPEARPTFQEATKQLSVVFEDLSVAEQ